MDRQLMAIRAAFARLAFLRGGIRRPVAAGWLSSRDPQAPGAGALRRQCDYFLYVPTTVSGRNRVPLLVMLHGCNQDARSFASGTRMNALADEQRFIVLYPQQSVRANPLRCWNWFTARTLDGAGEAAAIVALVRNVARRYPVDRSRVYVAGMSAGGAMTATLAFCYGAIFAACAIVSGVMYRAAHSAHAAAEVMRGGARLSPESTAAEAARRVSRRLSYVPALVMHGGHDTVVHPRNAEQIVTQFRKFAELVGSPPQRLGGPVEEQISGDGRSHRQRDYTRNDQVVLRSILIEGLGHAWSGGDDREAFNDPQPPDASRLIWDFVSTFRRPAPSRWRLIRVWLRQLLRHVRR
jgi:poly(hydroxyalkanoate) depolymerase family esterase